MLSEPFVPCKVKARLGHRGRLTFMMRTRRETLRSCGCAALYRRGTGLLLIPPPANAGHFMASKLWQKDWDSDPSVDRSWASPGPALRVGPVLGEQGHPQTRVPTSLAKRNGHLVLETWNPHRGCLPAPALFSPVLLFCCYCHLSPSFPTYRSETNIPFQCHREAATLR